MDAAHAQRIVVDLVKATGARDVVKIKTMTSAEVELNDALEKEGITAYETDLAELIVQLGDDLPSHIVVPAIHRNRDEIRDIFLSTWVNGDSRRPTTSRTCPRTSPEPPDYTCANDSSPRSVGICGANFLIAETGSSPSSNRRVTGECVSRCPTRSSVSRASTR